MARNQWHSQPARDLATDLNRLREVSHRRIFEDAPGKRLSTDLFLRRRCRVGVIIRLKQYQYQYHWQVMSLTALHQQYPPM